MMNQGGSKEEIKGWRKFLTNVMCWPENIKNKEKWFEHMGGMLSLVATVIATITFQSAINPPGGVRPAESFANETEVVKCNDTIIPCPGQAILAVVYPNTYTIFLFMNTICFVSSSAVCLLLVSGLPLHNRFLTLLFSVCMCITLTSLTLTYLFGAKMVTPDNLWGRVISMVGIVIVIWMILLALVTFCVCLPQLVSIVNKWTGRGNQQDPTPQDQTKPDPTPEDQT
ncbi:mitogen-activated protein kinase 15 [Spatholobus suberectus]|nr:mitogen-activated protein kinase 15 [Spatholobus suberectus]